MAPFLMAFEKGSEELRCLFHDHDRVDEVKGERNGRKKTNLLGD
jgi:hypothetical protein